MIYKLIILFNLIVIPTRVASPTNNMVIEIEIKGILLYQCSEILTCNKRRIFPKGSKLKVYKLETADPITFYISIDCAPATKFINPISLVAKGHHSLEIRSVNSITGEEQVETFSYMIVESTF